MRRYTCSILLLVSTILTGTAQEKLPLFDKEKSTIQNDWLIDHLDAKTKLLQTPEGHLVLSNGIVSRTFTLHPNGATISLNMLTTNEEFLRSVRPEAELSIDGITLPVGGLTGQPTHSYLKHQWIETLQADPLSFKLTGYKVEDTKARFPWKKRLEWMPKDLPWPAPGKELIFTYKLDDQAIAGISRQSITDNQRIIYFQENFAKINSSWNRYESKAYPRNSFINEGKFGEIMAQANTSVYAEIKAVPDARVFIAKINPGTDRSSSWGPGMALIFNDKTVKLNLRTAADELGFYDGTKEQVLKNINTKAPVWLRFELSDGHIAAAYSYDKESWTSAGEVAATSLDKPSYVRVGKMDWKGGNSDNADKGEEGRCMVEQVQMLGNISREASMRAGDKLSYLKSIEVSVHYELYDNLPVFSKWVTVHNLSGQTVQLNRFKSEILAAVEAESNVDSQKSWIYPNITVETDYNFGGMTRESIQNSSIAWNIDPLYKSQVSYERTTPCLLEVYPKYGPEQSIAPGSTFSTYRTWELLNDSWDRERKGLAHRRMMRAIAPWVTENPILMHVRSADPDAVKKAVDQCSEVGFENIIMTFGSGFNPEDTTSKNLNTLRQMADYAHSKGIKLGGYSLLASRSISKEVDVVMPAGKTPTFGNSPCIESEWGQNYFKQLYHLFEKTGLDTFEHDGSYPGDICASEKHAGHKGLDDSQWNQFKRISDFYKWCRAKGIYLNVPDYYFLSGSNKTGMGYREVNWSLPREQQEIIERQNIFDGTWLKTPSMGWMFVPLVEYQGGGVAATIEPLREHLPHYGQRLANLFGAGVQACYRGPQLYDAPETKELVAQWVRFYKQHRQILDADIVHIRRPDGRDYDAILHVDPFGYEKGLLMVYNPLDKPILRKIRINLYYTGLRSSSTLITENSKPQKIALDDKGYATITINIPANSQAWYIFR